MLAFEVSLNGEILYVAGFTSGMSMLTEVSVLQFPGHPRKLSLSTAIPGGSNRRPLTWGQKPLSVGDTVSVRIVDVEQGDPAQEVNPSGAIGVHVGNIDE